MRKVFVYIMTNKNRTTFYIGVTNAIKRRVLEHKTGKGSAFTKRYNLVDLVYFEKIEGLEECIHREKQLKNWHRNWKINLIKEDNPEMVDLAKDWYAEVDGQLVVKSGWQKISGNRTDPETSSG